MLLIFFICADMLGKRDFSLCLIFISLMSEVVYFISFKDHLYLFFRGLASFYRLLPTFVLDV